MPSTTPRPGSRPDRRAPMALAVLAVLTLVAACGGAVDASGDVGAGAAPGDAVEVVMVDNAFDPVAPRVPAGEEVTVEVVNRGDAVHNFVVEDLDLSTGTVEPGARAHATLVVPDDGVTFVCTIHPGMEGRLATS